MKPKEKNIVCQDSQDAELDFGSITMIDLRKQVDIPACVKKHLWGTMFPFVSIELLLQIEDGIRGFDQRVQMFMIDALNNCLQSKGRHYSTIIAVNSVLCPLYGEIEKKLLKEEVQKI